MKRNSILILTLILLFSTIMVAFSSCTNNVSDQERLLEAVYQNNKEVALKKNYKSIRLDTVSSEGSNTYYQDDSVCFLRFKQTDSSRYAFFSDEFSYFNIDGKYMQIITELSLKPNYWSQLDYSFILYEDIVKLEDDGNHITLTTKIDQNIAQTLSGSVTRLVKEGTRTSVFDSKTYALLSETISLLFNDGNSMITQKVDVTYDGETPFREEYEQIKYHLNNEVTEKRSIKFFIEKDGKIIDELDLAVPKGDGIYYSGIYQGIRYKVDESRSTPDLPSARKDLIIYLINDKSE